jgi:urease accessory protein UreH
MLLLSPAGALFEGDRVDLRVICGPRTCVVLTDAAATKLNACSSGEIDVRMRVDVGPGASFRYLPHELIPMRDARYRQTIELFLEADAQAAVLEVVGPGRSGQRFAYTQVELSLEAMHQGRPVVRERFRITQSGLADFSHYGSMLLLGPSADQQAADRAAAALAQAGAYGSASLLPEYGIGIKALGTSAHTLRGALLRSCALPAWLVDLALL